MSRGIFYLCTTSEKMAAIKMGRKSEKASESNVKRIKLGKLVVRLFKIVGEMAMFAHFFNAQERRNIQIQTYVRKRNGSFF